VLWVFPIQRSQTPPEKHVVSADAVAVSSNSPSIKPLAPGVADPVEFTIVPFGPGRLLCTTDAMLCASAGHGSTDDGSPLKFAVTEQFGGIFCALTTTVFPMTEPLSDVAQFAGLELRVTDPLRAIEAGAGSVSFTSKAVVEPLFPNVTENRIGPPLLITGVAD